MTTTTMKWWGSLRGRNEGNGCNERERERERMSERKDREKDEKHTRYQRTADAITTLHEVSFSRPLQCLILLLHSASSSFRILILWLLLVALLCFRHRHRTKITASGTTAHVYGIAPHRHTKPIKTTLNNHIHEKWIIIMNTQRFFYSEVFHSVEKISNQETDSRLEVCLYDFISFPGTNFPGTIFPGTNFPGTIFPGTSFPGTIFWGSIFRGPNFRGPFFRGPTFRGPFFRRSIFRGPFFLEPFFRVPKLDIFYSYY